ncbi:recombinase family protein [Roseomonas ludipueritiae]|uniref:Recombinase family protein n=1 Tax=Pseudoroseomonas ludipueritiae TaxID=198093 RepID=A0ABR7R2K5_9PROT|nr:recombinase family protein [Pseudoroseomonas ludipueritiae]
MTPSVMRPPAFWKPLAGWLLLPSSRWKAAGGAIAPQFAKAVALCRTTGATLLIAQLDRLARDVDFLRALQASGAKFVAADLPAGGQLTLETMLVAAEEAALVASARISTAMAAAKARGVKIGGWRGGPDPESTAGNAAKSRKADAFAQKIAPVAAQLRAEGRTLGQVAQILTERGIRTARDGSTWTAMGVLRVLNRRER